jgi:Putative lactococcus lactis phage r1t holin
MALETYSFWRDVLERSARQALQVALPIAVAVAASNGERIKLLPTLYGLILAVAVTILKAIVGAVSSSTSPIWIQLLDRVGSAIAGTLLAFLPSDLLNVLGVDWSAVAWAAVASALVAFGSYYAAPPSRGVAPFAPVAPVTLPS